ncbi:MAG TPA: Uma2 family endonuclease [Steroidobacteraceae bacterium]|jgi:Uma2 family endonuclease|nr:Uma2 family endonuclease [Steroidobacteraceae bacterium]
MDEFPRRHRITVGEYYRMAEVGLLAPDARVELIDGEIFDMPPIGSRHAALAHHLHHLLSGALGHRAMARMQVPVRLDDYSEPQPDVSVVAYREDFYVTRHPIASEVLLLVEVSETTLRYDQQIKGALYAHHGIPEYWIVDMKRKQLHVSRRPTSTGYVETVSIDRPATMPVIALPEAAVDVSPLFASI